MTYTFMLGKGSTKGDHILVSERTCAGLAASGLRPAPRLAHRGRGGVELNILLHGEVKACHTLSTL